MEKDVIKRFESLTEAQKSAAYGHVCTLMKNQEEAMEFYLHDNLGLAASCAMNNIPLLIDAMGMLQEV